MHLWGWVSSSFGGLSEIRQGLEKDGGGGLGWSFLLNLPDSLGIWMPRTRMKLPPELYPVWESKWGNFEFKSS